jgi:hypothetical protein
MHRMLPRGARRGDSQPGLGLREMKPFRAIHEHAGRRLARVELSRVDLGDVGDEIRLAAPRLLQKLGQAPKELMVREALEIWFVSHGEVWTAVLPQ